MEGGGSGDEYWIFGTKKCNIKMMEWEEGDSKLRISSMSAVT